MEAKVCYKGQNKTLKQYVVGGEGPSLLGRDWLTELQLEWRELYLANKSHPALQKILNKHPPVFKGSNWNKGKVVCQGQSQTLLFQGQNCPSCLKNQGRTRIEKIN